MIFGIIDVVISMCCNCKDLQPMGWCAALSARLAATTLRLKTKKVTEI